MKWTRPYADRCEYARMVKEVVTTIHPQDASAMKRDLSVVGIDIAKHGFHVIGMDKRGKIILRKRL
jgi:hypothetical protein